MTFIFWYLVKVNQIDEKMIIEGINVSSPRQNYVIKNNSECCSLCNLNLNVKHTVQHYINYFSNCFITIIYYNLEILISSRMYWFLVNSYGQMDVWCLNELLVFARLNRKEWLNWFLWLIKQVPIINNYISDFNLKYNGGVRQWFSTWGLQNNWGCDNFI